MVAQNSDLRSGNASLTSHVLDLVNGRPAAGVCLDLWAIQSAELRHVKRLTTNHDGRFEQPLLVRPEFTNGSYRLEFDLHSYFKGVGFFRTISIDVNLTDPIGHYHVPLLASPWSYSTYQGAPSLDAPSVTPPLFNAGDNPAEPPLTARPPPAGNDGGTGVSTHVIDLARGCGAGNMNISVKKAYDDSTTVDLGTFHTTTEGRTVEWLVGPDELEPCEYRLTFHIGDYYRAMASWVQVPLFTEAHIRFIVTQPLEHHHIPLLVAPWGYSFYRGS